MIITVGILVLIGWLSDSLRFAELARWPILGKYLLILLWAAVQQHALQAFFNLRAQEVWGKGFASILFATSIFALFHLPNAWLTVATFVGGFIWTFVYQRVPNLFALSISQALMTTFITITLPPWALHGARVGYNYYRL
jgi:hypothetical protein